MDPRMMPRPGQSGMYPQPDPGDEEMETPMHEASEMKQQVPPPESGQAAYAGAPPDMSTMEGMQDTGDGFSDLTVETVFEEDPRVRYVLWNRISVLDEAEVEILDQMVTPENITMWLKMFPELAELLQQATAMDAVMGMGQESMPAQQQMPMPQQGQMMQQMPASNGLAGQRMGG